jgi:poly-gamma-glutamate capsule biosynthesis protein CapA/YwtB (metallophosphatase superfamily)
LRAAGLSLALTVAFVSFRVAARAEPPAGSEPPATERTAQGVEVALVGHIVLGSAWPKARPWLPSGDGMDLATDAAPLLGGADLVVGNLSVPLTDHDAPRFSRFPDHDYIMRTPGRYAAALRRLGLDVVLAANNHALDAGREGWQESLARLAAVGIDAVGLRGSYVVRRVRGTRVSVVGFTQPYTDAFQAHTPVEAAASLVREAREAADVVIAYVHAGAEGPSARTVLWGPEFVGSEFRGNVVRIGRALAEAGASVVAFVGAHHPRAMEFHRGVLIAYGLGNFLTWGNFNLRAPNHLSLVLRVRFAPDGALEDARVEPVRLRYPGTPFSDPYRWVLPFLRKVSRASFGAGAAEVHADGRVLPPASR